MKNAKEYFYNILNKVGYSNYYDYQKKDKHIDYNSYGLWQKELAGLLNYIFKIRGKTVLDIGCASGNILFPLHKIYKCKCFGVELDKKLVETSKFKKEVKIINDEAINIDKYFEEKTFDLIYSIQTFEHFPGMDYSYEVLKKIYKLLKDDSFCYINLVMGKHLTKEEIFEKAKQGIEDITHVNIYPYKQWNKFAVKAGFKNVTAIVQPVFDCYVCPSGYSYFVNLQWHQIFLFKPKNINIKQLKQKFKNKLYYIMHSGKTNKDIVGLYLSSRHQNIYRKIMLDYISK